MGEWYLDRLRSAFRIVGGLVLAVALAGCAAAIARNPVPVSLEGQAQVVGMEAETVRFWGDELPPNTEAIVKEKWAQTRQNRPELLARGRPVMTSLALSGGGSDGAFGAGLLGGWTASGKRPEFDIVTGVSTGALTAPFAFLGPKYDGVLKEVFTQSDTKDVAIIRPVRGLLGGDALASNAPLAKVIDHYITEAFLEEVAAEHRRGRRLLIGTTNLDAERPVIWDMGAIATSGSPEALDLFRTVLLASAAIPAVFPPGFIKVSAGGSTYEEMHVDGGATREVFLVPTQFMASKVDGRLGIRPIRRTYIIRNGHVAPEYKVVKARTLSIAGRAVSSLIKSQGVGDLYQLYVFCKRNGIDYNLAYIPADFHDTSTQAFEPDYMSRLYELGYQMAGGGYPWKKQPPQMGGN